MLSSYYAYHQLPRLIERAKVNWLPGIPTGPHIFTEVLGRLCELVMIASQLHDEIGASLFTALGGQAQVRLVR